MNSYCRKEFRSEEYFHLKDICASCGSELKFKHEVEETTSARIKDRGNALLIIDFLQNFVKQTEALPFPAKPTLTAFAPAQAIEAEAADKKEKKENDSDIDENLLKFIDYDLKYIKLSKNFFKRPKTDDSFLGNKARFSETLKNVKKEVKAFFRARDLKECVCRSTMKNAARERYFRMLKIKAEHSKLEKEAYKKLHKERLGSMVYLN